MAEDGLGITHTDESHIIVMGASQADRENPVNDGTLDDGPGQNTAARRFLDFLRSSRLGGRGLRLEDLIQANGPGNILAIPILVCLEGHAGLIHDPRPPRRCLG